MERTSETVRPNGECEAAAHALPLSAGRTLLVLKQADDEEIQIRAPSGAVEVRIILTEQGPVVRLEACRVEVTSADEIDLRCRNFSLHTQEEARFTSDGQVRLFAKQQLLLRAKEEVDIKGRPVRTNVWDGWFYDDYKPAVNGEHWGTAFAGVQSSPAVVSDAVETSVDTVTRQFEQLQHVLQCYGML